MTKYRITNPITEARVKAHIKDSETYEKRLCEAVEKQETSNLSYVELVVREEESVSGKLNIIRVRKSEVGGMNTKAELAKKFHDEFLKRNEFAPWLPEAWVLEGFWGALSNVSKSSKDIKADYGWDRSNVFEFDDGSKLKYKYIECNCFDEPEDSCEVVK